MDDLFSFLIASILLIFGTVLGGVLLWKISDMIRSSIKGKRNNEYEDSFNRMAQAFINHKKETERRLQNIEAIVSQESETPTDKKLDKPRYESIEIVESPGRMENALKQDEKTNKQKRKTQ